MTLRTYAHAVEAADAPIAQTLSHVLDGFESIGAGIDAALSNEVIDRRDGNEHPST
jgi:hypothetical protein